MRVEFRVRQKEQKKAACYIGNKRLGDRILKWKSTILKIELIEINIQVFINTYFDRVSKGVLFGIAGVKVVDNDKVLEWIHNPIFTNTCGPVFE